jgi:hypothetical protein
VSSVAAMRRLPFLRGQEVASCLVELRLEHLCTYLLCPAHKALIEDGCVNCWPIGIVGCLNFLPVIGIVMSSHVIGVLFARLENDVKIGTHVGYI